MQYLSMPMDEYFEFSKASILNNPIAQQMVWNNTAAKYILSAAIFIGLIIFFALLKRYFFLKLKKLAKKTKNQLDDMFTEVINKIKWPFYAAISLYIAALFLTLPEIAKKGLNYLLIIVITYEIIKVLYVMIEFMTERAIEKDTKGNKEIIKLIGRIVKIILIILAAVLILSNLGYNVSSLIAGLGIGGIAVALAIQNILGDIFSSLSIYFDKPFKTGDVIAIGTDKGTVKKIGLKSTRIETLQGEELVISNNELTSVRIQNFKKMKKRRAIFQIGVIYEISAEKLEKIPEIIKNIITKNKGVEFGRCHFANYGDFSLNFEIVYFVNSNDHKEYMDVQQKINLEIFKTFQKEKIEFAYPTQTVLVNK